MRTWTPMEAIGKIVVSKAAHQSMEEHPALSLIVFAGTVVRLGTGENADITYKDLMENYWCVCPTKTGVVFKACGEITITRS